MGKDKTLATHLLLKCITAGQKWSLRKAGIIMKKNPFEENDMLLGCKERTFSIQIYATLTEKQNTKGVLW